MPAGSVTSGIVVSVPAVGSGSPGCAADGSVGAGPVVFSDVLSSGVPSVQPAMLSSRLRITSRDRIFLMIFQLSGKILSYSIIRCRFAQVVGSLDFWVRDLTTDLYSCKIN